METQSTIVVPSKKKSPVDPLLTPAEAAAYIGVTGNTLSVWRCVRRYDIKFIKVGRLVRYRLSDLDSWLESRTCSTGEID